MPSDPPASSGSKRSVRIGKYDVLAHVATGGMGAVYRARDIDTRREVALKVLTPEMAAKPALLERFRREARAAAKLLHENIVTLYEFGEANGVHFIAMEFVEGVDLHEYVNRKGALDPKEARLIVSQACRALAHAYSRGIVHRDVKPSNFLIAQQEGGLVVKLTDLGLARESNGDEHRVTRAGTTVGTLDYMAPEQACDSGKADARSDLYALGATWFHLLVGQAPFAQGGLGERLNKLMNEPAPNVRDLNPSVPAGDAAVLGRLLAKKPARRHQTPSELLADLQVLDRGRTPVWVATVSELEAPASAARSSSKVARTPRKKVKDRPRSRADSETDSAHPAATAPIGIRRHLPYYIAAGAVLLAALVVTLVLLLDGDKPSPSSDKDTGTPVATAPPVKPPPPVRPPEPPVRNPPALPPATQPPGQTVKPPKPDPETKPPVVQPPAKPKLAVLYKPSEKLDAAALRREIDEPWSQPPAVGPAFHCRVGRLASPGEGPWFPTLAAALEAAPKKQTCVIEIHDNGPLYDTHAHSEDRDVVLRAGKGFRPLLVWDLRRVQDERARLRKSSSAETGKPLVFLDVAGGRLTVEDVDLALSCPDSVAMPGTLLRVHEGDLEVLGCTFSVAGKARAPITLARVEGGQHKARCRFRRCFARGASLSTLHLEAPGARVLFDDCLVVGGEPTLLQVRADSKEGATLHLVRSTFVCGQNLLSVQSAAVTDLSPSVRVLVWDALLSRSAIGPGGELLALGEGADTRGMSWRAINSVYAGWQSLLGGARRISSVEVKEWRRQWLRSEGEGALAEPWPVADPGDVAEVGAAAYRTEQAPVGFASSVAPDRPLGCDLEVLPPTRDGWLNLTHRLFIVPLAEGIPEDSLPEIPNPGDGLYHGERLDLDMGMDLGNYLEAKRRNTPFGKDVVLYLAGSGDRETSPLRFKGVNVTLYFERPAEGRKPLVLVPKTADGAEPRALLDVEAGELDMVAGRLRLPAVRAGAPRSLIRVQGGNLRLLRCRLEGSERLVSDSFHELIDLEGSGASLPERAQVAVLQSCVLVSGRDGVLLHGVGSRLSLRKSLVVTGRDAFHLDPSPGYKGRANLECVLTNVTVASQGGVFRLEDVAQSGIPVEPVVIQTQACAFLHPFILRPNRSTLLLDAGSALTRGLVIWQGNADSFDARLEFGVARSDQPLPPAPEGAKSWLRLWGSFGVRHAQPELVLTQTLPSPWQLERLRLAPGRGADLSSLDLLPRKKPKTPPVNPPRLPLFPRLRDRLGG